jgi:hydrogenase-4 component E
VGTDALLAFLALTDLLVLGAGRTRFGLRVTALQGIVLGILTPVAAGSLGPRVVALAATGILTKGILIPWLLARGLVETTTGRREMPPYVGYAASLLFGFGGLALSFWIGGRLRLPDPVFSPLAVPLSFFTIFTGLFIIITRRTALTQVQGYLILENGVYAFGVAVSQEVPLAVELGILLDIFAGVFLMGIIIFHISREFDHVDTHRLSDLRE